MEPDPVTHLGSDYIKAALRVTLLQTGSPDPGIGEHTQEHVDQAQSLWE